MAPLRLDIRWAAGDANRIRRYTAELVARVPDVVLAYTSPIVASLQEATRTVPVVFAGVVDPVGAGFVESMARPGGNTTGFISFEYAIGAKWLELLKEVAPNVTRAAVANTTRSAPRTTGQGASVCPHALPTPGHLGRGLTTASRGEISGRAKASARPRRRTVDGITHTARCEIRGAKTSEKAPTL